MPVSSEFVTICRSQVALAASLGASASVVYLTEEILAGGEAKLIPIAAHPETLVKWEDRQGLLLLPEEMKATAPIRLLSAGTAALPAQAVGPAARKPSAARSESQQSVEEGETWRQGRQLVVPLMHEGAVLGLLVTGREDRAWSELEEVQMERIAHTLTFACILDQRSHWFEQQLSHHQQIETQQHNLLHQLKSPLTAVRTFGKLLLRRLLPEDKNREVANSILRESDRLQELLQRFSETVEIEEVNLSLSPQRNDTISRQEVIIEPSIPVASTPALGLLPASNFVQACSATEVLEPLLVSAQAIAEERQLKLQANIPNNLPLLKANAKALREVLSNLIDNALKYTPTGGQVYIQVGNGKKGRNKNVEPLLISDTFTKIPIAISDNGYGIPPADLEHLFERHYRGEKAQTEIPGTGLGLAIARDLIHEMQGDIEVFSPANPHWLSANLRKNLAFLKRGTTFVVWLQVAQSEGID